MNEVLNLEPLDYSRRAIKIWENNGFSYRENSYEETLLQKRNFDTVILIVRLSHKIGEEILDKFPSLKYLLTATTGTDHIDIEAIKSRKIELICLKGHNEFLKTIPSTSELTWGLILSLVRKIPQAYNDVLNGNWNRDIFKGNQLKDKNIGIIGLGRTGLLVAKYAKSFEMKVCYFDPYVKDIDNYKKYETIESLLQASDVVSIHVHLTEETKHLINSSNIYFLKPNSFLINTSRGKIIEEKALLDAIITKKIHGYAADVLYNELNTDLKEDELIDLMNRGYNIVLTPHIGGATFEAMQMCEEYLANYLVNLL